jgi:hypothetical protein
MRDRLLCLLTPLLCATIAFAADGPEKNPETPLATWLSDHQVSVRRTFDGSKDEAKPASFTWINHDGVNGKSFFDVHLGVKVGECEPIAGKLLIYPVAEWHRTSSEKDPVDKLSGKVAVEWRPVQLEPSSTLAPFLLANAQYARDFEKSSWKTTVSAALSAISNRNWWPGNETRLATDTHMIRYYIYAGAEYYDKLPVVQGEPLWVGLARVQGEWHLLRSRAKGPWQSEIAQVRIEYAFRRRISGGEGIDCSLGLFAGEIDWFLDRRAHVAISYRYQRGNDPLTDFAFNERSSLGVTAKF